MGTRTHQQLLRKQFSSCCSALLLLQSLAIAVLFVASCVLLRDEHGASLASSADAPVWYEDFDSGELGRCVDSALELKSSFPDLMGCEEMEPYSAMVEERSKTVEFLGKGHFRNVYALYLDDERAVVYKKMKKKHKESSKRTRSLARERREAAILGALRDNPHLVHIVGLCEFDIITERMPGSLHRLLFSEEREPLSENQVLSMALDAARALQAIHGLDPPVVHADIKPEQFLINEKGILVLNDLNRARIMKVLPETSKLCPFKISKSNGVWRSPEEYAFGLLTEKIDIYSLANVFYSMLSGEYPYEGPSKASWPRAVRRGMRPLCSPKWHPQLVRLMQDMWNEVPGLRPSAADIVVRLEKMLAEFNGAQKVEVPVSPR